MIEIQGSDSAFDEIISEQGLDTPEAKTESWYSGPTIPGDLMSAAELMMAIGPRIQKDTT